jgi:hypothetical protein
MFRIPLISRSVLVCAAMAGIAGCDSARTTAPAATPTAPRFALIDNERDLPFAFSVNTCDETVDLSGVYHVVVASTTSASDNTTDRFHINAKGTGVGETSGATYQWNDAINQTQNIRDGAGIVISAPQTTALVGQGGVSDIHFRARFHVTVNANGDLTVVIDQFDAICK